jgi:hypothetical protein
MISAGNKYNIFSSLGKTARPPQYRFYDCRNITLSYGGKHYFIVAEVDSACGNQQRMPMERYKSIVTLPSSLVVNHHFVTYSVPYVTAGFYLILL